MDNNQNFIKWLDEYVVPQEGGAVLVSEVFTAAQMATRSDTPFDLGSKGFTRRLRTLLTAVYGEVVTVSRTERGGVSGTYIIGAILKPDETGAVENRFGDFREEADTWECGYPRRFGTMCKYGHPHPPAPDQVKEETFVGMTSGARYRFIQSLRHYEEDRTSVGRGGGGWDSWDNLPPEERYATLLSWIRLRDLDFLNDYIFPDDLAKHYFGIGGPWRLEILRLVQKRYGEAIPSLEASLEALEPKPPFSFLNCPRESCPNKVHPDLQDVLSGKAKDPVGEDCRGCPHYDKAHPEVRETTDWGAVVDELISGVPEHIRRSHFYPTDEDEGTIRVDLDSLMEVE